MKEVIKLNDKYTIINENGTLTALLHQSVVTNLKGLLQEVKALTQLVEESVV